MYTLYTVLEYTNNIEYLNNTNDITNPGNPINGNDTMLLRLRFSQYYVYSCLLRTESEQRIESTNIIINLIILDHC